MGEPQAGGLLYVEVECPLELEREFHAWYNLEHVPERLRIPGFIDGRRYAALEGEPRWLAAYWLEGPAVLNTPVYREWTGPRQTPWTKRMVSTTRVRRSVLQRVYHQGRPGSSGAAGLLAVRYGTPEHESGELHAWHDGLFARELTRIAGVATVERHEDVETSEQLVLYHLANPWVTQEEQFGRVWTEGWERRRDGVGNWQRTLYIRIL